MKLRWGAWSNCENCERLFGYEGSRWCALFWFVDWSCISLGVHFCLSAPNIEIHVPFGFFKFGRQKVWHR